MYLYMAAGLPVLSTEIWESRLNEHVIVSNADCTSAYLREVLDTCTSNAGHANRKKFASNNTWDARATQVDKILQNYGI
jgi:hypothetical protein